MSLASWAFRFSVLSLLVAALTLQAHVAAAQRRAGPSQFHLSPDLARRLAFAAEDSTLAPWQREFMLEVTQAAPESTAVEDGEWTPFFPPPGRDSHTAIYDPVRDRMVVFGGWDGGDFRSDVWELSLAGNPAWSRLATAGTPPSGRYGHTAIYDRMRDRMIVFGGNDLSPRNDVWALSLTGSPAWSEIAPAGNPPLARSDHTAIYDPVRDRVVVFGGRDSWSRNDVWVLSLAGDPQWSEVAPAGSPPSMRYNHTAIYDPVRDRMVVFGGYDGSPRNDVWALSFAGSPAWSALTPAGSLPPALLRHTAIYDPVRDRMVVFGGLGGGDNGGVWTLLLAESPAWSAHTPSGSLPPARSDHTALYDPVRDRMVVFAGRDASSRRNDTSALSLGENPTWTALTPTGTLPPARSDHTAIHDPVRDRMVVFGGVVFGPLGDVWALSLTGSPTWSPLAPLGSPPSPRFGHTAIYDPVRDRMLVYGGFASVPFGDVWALSLADSPAWSLLVPAGTPPPTRYHHSAIYDSVRDRMVVFGGYNNNEFGTAFGDAWVLSLAGSPAWSRLTTTGTPPSGRYGHTAVYDRTRDRMIVIGGNGLSNDVWALSLAGSPAWSEMACEGGPPPGRIWHTAIHDPVRDRVLVFGGYPTRNDVWALSLTGIPTWRALAPAGGPPPARYGHTAVHDPVRDRMVVFGGYPIRNDPWGLTLSPNPVAALVSLAHAEAQPDRVSITWFGSGLAGRTAWVDRCQERFEWRRLSTISADGTGMFRYDDRAVAAGSRYAYRLAYRDGEGPEIVTAETWVEVPAAVSFALEGLRPNPTGAELIAVFALPDGAPAALAVLDITGRQLLAREVGSLGAGRHTLRVTPDDELPAGIYWLRLERLGHVRLAKAIILR